MKISKRPSKAVFQIYKWNSTLYQKCHISKNSENRNGQREKMGCSRPKVFCKNCIFRIFTKFTGKHLCQSLFLIKLQVLGKNETQVHSCFPVNFAKFPRTPPKTPPVVASDKMNLWLMSWKLWQYGSKKMQPFSIAVLVTFSISCRFSINNCIHEHKVNS